MGSKHESLNKRIRETISGLSDKELADMQRASAEDYTPFALQVMEQELSRRRRSKVAKQDVPPAADFPAVREEPGGAKRGGCCIEVWSRKNFEGEYLKIEGPGEYQSLELASVEWGDSISSLRVGPSAFVFIYSEKEFEGAMITLGPTQEISNLKELSFNDKADSIRLVNSLKVFDRARPPAVESSGNKSPGRRDSGRRLSKEKVMNAEANKAVVNRFIEALWNQRRLELADELFSVDCVTHQLGIGADPAGAPRGPEAMKHHVSEWLTSFPDLEFGIEQMVAEDDRVMTQILARGRHQAEWLGIPATGKMITIQMFVVHRIADGQIVEDWVLVDSLGVLQQLGLVAPTEELLALGGNAKAG